MDIILNLIPSILMITAPIMIAALGGMFAERSGVTNIGLEGLMGFGAFAAAASHVVMEQYLPGASIWIALLIALAVGLIISLVHAFASISLNADQIVSGTGINLIAIGGTVFLSQIFFKQDRTPPYRHFMPTLPGSIYPTVVIAVTLLIIISFVLYKLPLGLRLRACGEHPATAASAGINVRKLRYFAVLVSGALAGLAGGCLVLTQTIQYTWTTINGTGFIALAAVSFGRWIPAGVSGAALLFGSAVGFAIYSVNINALRGVLPPEFFSILPYLITLAALIIFSGKDYAPRSVGQPYEKGNS